MSDESGPEYIQAELLNFGVEMKLDLALKLHHLGAAYGKSDDDMVSEWFAYASSLTDGTPTLEKILAMEAKTLVKTTAPPPIRTPKITAAPAMDRSTVDVEMDDVLEAYLGEVSSGEVSFGSSAPKVAKTPTVTRNRTTALRETKQSKFTPGTYSPGSSTPSEKYQGRKDRGTIMEAVKFGEAFDPKTWKTRKPAEISVEVKLWSDLWSLTGKYTYMCDRLDIQRQVHFTAAEELGKDITEALDGGAEIFPCNYASNDDYFSIGRVFCDARGAGKLNEASICLENCSAEAPGSIVKLDVSQLAASAKNLALFPGQVVVVKGSNPTGQKLVASEIHAGLLPKVVESDFSIGENGPLRIAICSGPFTVNSNLLYEPWKDLVEEIKDLKPHVLFLFGPFIDAQNTVVNEATVEFSSIFDDLITHLTTEIDCPIAVVSSSNDVFHDNVYPTPPYPSKDKYGGKVKFFADPSIIDVNGLVFACSSTDILMQLGREECSLASGDRFYRLGEQLLKQRSFYPLYPPGVNVDYSHYEAHVDLPIRPHFMLLPSMFSPFVRRVGGTVLVNPGYLCKANSGGTFALMEIDPGFKGSEETAQGMRVRVVRI